MGKLLTSIGEERNMRKLKCGTSYHVCFCVKLSAIILSCISSNTSYAYKEKKASTHLSLSKREKQRRGLAGTVAFIRIFSPGRWLEPGLKAHPLAPAQDTTRD
jgi:hypothetical protein